MFLNSALRTRGAPFASLLLMYSNAVSRARIPVGQPASKMSVVKRSCRQIEPEDASADFKEDAILCDVLARVLKASIWAMS